MMIKRNLFPGIFSGKKMRRLPAAAAALLLSIALAATPVTVMAESDYKILTTVDGLEDYYGEMLYNQDQPVQTNEVASWPKGPAISAAAAVVMDADSGVILYSKNQDMRLYPASITKVLTALLAYENLSLSDKITFSEEAIFGIESGSSNIGMDVGEAITVDEALYGLLVASANEVANALGEKVSGSESAFVDLMNKRAVELGCTNSHFVTTNGLHDKEHYSTAHDMAMIAREVYSHPKLVDYFCQSNYEFKATDTQPDDFWLGNTNDFLNGAIPCEDVLGGKTGYTDEARETLVTFAERDGRHLICVIMRDEPPYQYYDTIDLLDYGFKNFKNINVAEKEDRFTMKPADFLSSGNDIFGRSEPYYSIPDGTLLTIPKKASFEDLTARIEPATAAAAEGKTSSVTASAGAAGKDDHAVDTAANDDSSSKNNASVKTDAAETASTASAANEHASSGTDTDSAMTGSEENRVLGSIHYAFNNYELGTIDVLFTPDRADAGDAATETASAGGTATLASDLAPGESGRTARGRAVPEEVHGIRALLFHFIHTGAHGSIYLNILLLIPILLAIAFLLCVFFFASSYFDEMDRLRRMKTRRAKQAARYGTPADRYDSDLSDPDDTPRTRSVRRAGRSKYPDEGRTAVRRGSGSNRTVNRSGRSGRNTSSAGSIGNRSRKNTGRRVTRRPSDRNS